MLRYCAKRLEGALAVFLALVLVVLLARLILPDKAEAPVSLADVGAFQIPMESFRELRRLSEEKGLRFFETLAVYSEQERYFPPGGSPLSAGMIEDYFFPSYSKLKRESKGEAAEARMGMLEEILSELEAFPVKAGADSYTYSDTWGASRVYGGERIHEGTDILDKENSRGRLAVASMTGGKVVDAGWGRLGGYNVGIRSKSGTYYYYAHLESIDPGIKEGDTLKAGAILGRMGDTGYGEKGERGRFPVHLHVGISPDVPFAEEFWINPYPFLRHLEDMRASV
jgi:murein DD-endopeptidase MepM/ murein hydrolase activator NlpD